MAELNKLYKISAVGFVACCGSYYLFQRSLSKTLINSEYCKDAMVLLKSHNGAVNFLGEPIQPVSAKFSDYKKSPKCVEMIVLGPKSPGKVYLTVNEIGENQFELGSVQLQIGKDDSRRLEIKSYVTSASQSP